MNFERGIDPKESIEIGMGAVVQERLQEMLIDFNENNEEKIICIFDGISTSKDARILVIKGEKINETGFFIKVEKYLMKYNFLRYLEFPGQQRFGSFSFPIARYIVVERWEKYFKGTQIDW